MHRLRPERGPLPPRTLRQVPDRELHAAQGTGREDARLRGDWPVRLDRGAGVHAVAAPHRPGKNLLFKFGQLRFLF